MFDATKRLQNGRISALVLVSPEGLQKSGRSYKEAGSGTFPKGKKKKKQDG